MPIQSTRKFTAPYLTPISLANFRDPSGIEGPRKCPFIGNRGTGPYPSVTVRLDFRGLDIGDFAYHCHILEHEDHGMMAIIRVLPKE
ncbi:MAG TPA: multicopper oxidase domain-containing protein [Candidatus Sulfotelmatobacter sp.]|nr:multicopper oxidase domain-containing protein [Candidatus Sulfotelmatobacter sp.]